MASKAKSAESEDAPLIDLNEGTIKKLITKGQEKGLCHTGRAECSFAR